MKPIRFGTPERQLAGLYLPAAADARGESVLLCCPFGQEAIRAQRVLYILAERLARAGFDVLRFDYFATGDALGDDEDGDIDGWVGDVLSAHTQLCFESKNTRCSWIGLRLGAAIAALASAKLSVPLEKLILWDPVINGSDYLVELAHAHKEAMQMAYGIRYIIDQKLREVFQCESSSEALGFPLTSRLRTQLEALSPASFAHVRALNVNIFSADLNLSMSEVELQFAANNVDHKTTLLSPGVVWTANEMMNASLVPARTLEVIADSLTGKTK